LRQSRFRGCSTVVLFSFLDPMLAVITLSTGHASDCTGDVFNKPECRRGRCGKEAAKNRRCIVFWGLQTVVRKGFAVASRTYLFSTPKFSFSLVRPVYLLTLVDFATPLRWNLFCQKRIAIFVLTHWASHCNGFGTLKRGNTAQVRRNPDN